MLTGCRPARPLFALLALAAASVVEAAVVELGRDHGLPSEQMHGVAQGADGRIYLAGPAGLTVYDGQRTRVLGAGDGLTTHGLRSVGTDAQGLLVVGGDAGVDRQLAEGGFQGIDGGGSEWRWGFVEDLVALPDGTLYFATARGLVRWSPGGGLKHLADGPTGGGLVKALVSVGGVVWAGGPGFGLVRLAGEVWSRPAAAKLRRVGAVEALAATAAGTLLVGGEFGLLETDGEGSVLAALIDPSGASRVTALAVRGSDVWAGMGTELVRLSRSGQAFERRERVRGDTLVNDIFLDREDNLWVATDNRGVIRISALHDLVRTPDAPCRAGIMAVRPRPAGGVLVAGDICSWVEYGDRQQPLTVLDRVKTWDLLDYEGRIWAATDTGLLELPHTGAPIQHGSDHPYLNAPGRVLAVIDGALWAGSVRGLARRSADGRWESVPLAGEEPGYIYTIEASPDGAWVGTIGKGLWRWDGESLQRANIPGLPADGNLYGIDLAHDGRLALTLDNRTYLIEDQAARALPPVSEDQVAGWAVAFQGESLWLGSSTGLRELDAATGAQKRRYTRGLGLAHEEFTTSRSLLIAGERIYAATAGGLTILQPGPVATLLAPPAVRLAGVEWRSAEWAPGGAVRPGNWSVSLQLFSPWYFDEQSLRFRYRLEGFDDAWVEAGEQAQAGYTALPPGEYRLHAQAYAPITGWGPEAPIWEVSVAPSRWQHPAALAGYALLAMGLFWLGILSRTRLLRARAERLEEAVDQRTRELAHANAELQRLAQQKDRMVSVVAHDLRTPLSVSKMYAEMLDGRLASKGLTRAKAADVIARSTSQALEVIDSMLGLQAIESGRAPLNPEPVDLVRLLGREAGLHGEVAQQRRGISVRFESALSTAMVVCDAARIQQVLHNLLGNAVKYSEDGSEIVVRLEPGDAGVTVRVSDQGTGIPAEDLEKVLRPYQRSTVSPLESQVGLGIGLSVCRLLVEQHGGRIGIDSELGVGTTVWFTLPWRCPDEEEPGTE